MILKDEQILAHYKEEAEGSNFSKKDIESVASWMRPILAHQVRETLKMVGEIAKREAITMRDSYGKEIWVIDCDDFAEALAQSGEE